MSWSFTFSWIKFGNVDEFLWVNISYERGWLSSLSWIPSLIESSGVNMYGLASTNWLISLRFVPSKLLHSIPKCFSKDSAKSSALFALVLAVLLSSVSVG